MKRYLVVRSIKGQYLFPPPTHFSTDGVVLEECLKEVKMIFLETMTLKEAECSQGICKKTSNGLIINQNYAYNYHSCHY